MRNGLDCSGLALKEATKAQKQQWLLHEWVANFVTYPAVINGTEHQKEVIMAFTSPGTPCEHDSDLGDSLVSTDEVDARPR